MFFLYTSSTLYNTSLQEYIRSATYEVATFEREVLHSRSIQYVYIETKTRTNMVAGGPKVVQIWPLKGRNLSKSGQKWAKRGAEHGGEGLKWCQTR